MSPHSVQRWNSEPGCAQRTPQALAINYLKKLCFCCLLICFQSDGFSLWPQGGASRLQATQGRPGLPFLLSNSYGWEPYALGLPLLGLTRGSLQIFQPSFHFLSIL